MSLTNAQIRPGTVAYISTNLLKHHEDIEPSLAVFPEEDQTICHVCFAVEGETSFWTPLTKIPPTQRFERLQLVRAWRLRGDSHPAWNDDPVYLRDGEMTYRGPKAAFVLAAAGEFAMDPRERPFLSADGVAAISEEVEARGGWTPARSKVEVSK